MSPNTSSYDDLSAIKGIGPTRAKWLRDNFAVKTYQELANLTISQIETRLKKDGKIVVRSDIESWISQARDLLARSDAVNQSNEISAQGELARKLNSAGHGDGWKPFASFLVYFQTREVDKNKTVYQTLVHHIEEDHETSWSGVETSGLPAWILSQISDYLGQHEEEEAVEYPEVPKETISLPETMIQVVRIYQPFTSETPIHTIKAGHLFNGELHHDQPFGVGIDFTLSREVAVESGETEIAYFARCYQYNKATHDSSLVSETSPLSLKPNKLNYTLNTPQVSLPCGDYRLVIMITNSRTDRLMPDFLELCAVKVDK